MFQDGHARIMLTVRPVERGRVRGTHRDGNAFGRHGSHVPEMPRPDAHHERNGVHVDQCGDCRGIFLDRGELERLMDAEDAGTRLPRHT